MKKLNMKTEKPGGYLFTFCGLDGCGKTTMITRLKEDLEKQCSVFLTKQPTDAVRESKIFRTFMDDPDHSAYDYRSLSLLAASDRLQHGSKVIEKELSNGKTVISDRYFYSCLANLRARGFKNDQWIYEIAESIIRPDAAFFFDVPVEIAVKRVRSREAEKDRYIDLDLQYRLREEYLKICKANKGILISTEQPIDDCYAIIKQKIRKVMKNGYRIESKRYNIWAQQLR